MKKALSAITAATVAMALVIIQPMPAGADPVSTGEASSFAVQADLGGQELIPPTPASATALPPGGEDSQTVIDIPADPLAVSGTLNADTAVHSASDLESALTTEVEQTVAGPYNAQAVASVEELDVLLDVPEADISLVSADVVRAEAVGVCSNGAVQYSAASEIVDLRVAGESLGLNPPVQDIIDAIGDLLDDTGLNAIVDVERDVKTVNAQGASVDALVIIVLAAAGDPLAEVHIGHAEVSGLACGAAPECSDNVDNADPEDELVDEDDPGCLSGPDGSYNPDDDDETDDETPKGIPECSDEIDNADPEDTLIDANDPGCLSGPGGTYNPNDDSEVDDDAARPLPRTGGSDWLLPVGAGLMGLAYLAHSMRRRALV